MAVVRLIAHIARRRNGDGLDYFSVIIGVFVKINDGQEVGGHASLVARPDIESLGRLVVVAVLMAVFVIVGECCADESQRQQSRSPDHGRRMQFVITFVRILPLLILELLTNSGFLRRFSKLR